MIVRTKLPEWISLEYKTPGACAFDMPVSEEKTIAPGEYALVETGVVIATPPGYVLMLAPRSSTFKNFGLMFVNSFGIIDQDYCGDNDTIKCAVINMKKESITLQPGDRIAQAMFVPVERAEFEVVTSMNTSDRGGFGTTGKS